MRELVCSEARVSRCSCMSEVSEVSRASFDWNRASVRCVCGKHYSLNEQLMMASCRTEFQHIQVNADTCCSRLSSLVQRVEEEDVAVGWRKWCGDRLQRLQQRVDNRRDDLPQLILPLVHHRRSRERLSEQGEQRHSAWRRGEVVCHEGGGALSG